MRFVSCQLILSFQTLLRHGANPDLRDEDGKTPLDKARERGHSEVVAILQSPGQLNPERSIFPSSSGLKPAVFPPD